MVEAAISLLPASTDFSWFICLFVLEGGELA